MEMSDLLNVSKAVNLAEKQKRQSVTDLNQNKNVVTAKVNEPYSAKNTLQNIFSMLATLSSQFLEANGINLNEVRTDDYKVKRSLYSVLLSDFVVIDIELDKLSSAIEAKVDSDAISAISAVSAEIEAKVESNAISTISALSSELESNISSSISAISVVLENAIISSVSAMSAEVKTEVKAAAIDEISAAMDKLSVVFRNPTPEEMEANPNVFYFVVDKVY